MSLSFVEVAEYSHYQNTDNMPLFIESYLKKKTFNPNRPINEWIDTSSCILRVVDSPNKKMIKMNYNENNYINKDFVFIEKDNFGITNSFSLSPLNLDLEPILKANYYTKTNVTFHLLNSTNNEMYNTSEIYYITPEGNEVKAPNSVPNNLPIGEYSWHFTAILVDLKCDFNMDGSPDGISVIPSTRLDEKVVIEENVVIEEKEGIQKFYDDREKEIGIISHQATRVNINCKV